ncbi:SDR family NAD(P)-dependent oxidoreductase [Calothrix sp. PCC 6303]|uniref:SDR family NAD(P)-dependent oxidoreductase n=1 Tax=Calothrix sp. PCC 6303 TaxID=1170562 RepID=UPI0002A024CA|nr:SDR family NAD(P)-dependent oxidoreductase [Calothrix sp. PCC 6303]AFY99647.1 short-chain dehydrogenase/reductase SDR [Calothrix sp. PCC 6303]
MTEKFLNQINPANVFIIGATQGIGLGFVQNLLQDTRVGKIYATYRSLDSAEKLLLTESEYPDKLTCLAMDITQETQIADCCQTIQSQVKKLHLVVNCVGFLHNSAQQPEKSLKHLNIDNLTRYFQINSIGGVLLAKHLVSLFKHPEPSIFASISAKVGSIGDNKIGGWYGYRASKAALNMLMRNVSIEYGRVCPKNIVVTLHPGTTDTRLSRPFQGNVTPGKLFSVEKTVSQLLEVIEGLQPSDSGEFFSWDGTKLPW